MQSQRRYAVIGAGISGLAGAYEISRRDPDAEIVVFEASDRIGGSIRTEQVEDLILEHGPDMYTAALPGVSGVVEELGLQARVIDTDPRFRNAFIARGRRLYPVPSGFLLMRPSRMWPMVTTRLLSLGGKLRLFAEPFFPPRRELSDESLADFALRRVGREAFERLVQPLVAGMYTADPYQLSMDAAMPQFSRMEQSHGSLFRATLASRRSQSEQVARAASGARYGQFKSFDTGMHVLPDALEEALPPRAIRLEQRVESLRRDETAWTLQLAGGESFTADAVLIAVPAYHAAALLKPLSEEAADELEGIPYASSAVVIVVADRAAVEHPLGGVGAVIPSVEQRDAVAISFAARKFTGRAPAEQEIFRVFLGGALRPDLCELSDDQLVERALKELRHFVGFCASPRLTRVVRWIRGMPQYHVGHLDRVARIRRSVAALPTLEVTGNALEGIGIPQCISAARNAAGRLVATR